MILTVNAGSSSLKVGLYPDETSEEPTITASIDRLDDRGGRWDVHGDSPPVEGRPDATYGSHADALRGFLDWLERRQLSASLSGVGHRIVHGDDAFGAPVVIDDEVVATLERFVPMDPTHMPQALACVAALRERLPRLDQVACFDTSFHRSMPALAGLTTFPRDLWSLGIRRYGFHGLSYEYITGELARIDPAAASRRTIVAHLGNGASMVAVRGGRSIETTMGMTPSGGLMMGTRTGDVDPGIIEFLLRQGAISPSDLDGIINARAGLLGVSGRSSDMRDLIAAMDDDPQSREAVELFCYLARKQLGGLAVALGGIDRIVFTGGIGQHAARIRSGICDGLAFLGVTIDPDRNEHHEPVISAPDATVDVRVMATNEEVVILRHVRDAIANAQDMNRGGRGGP